MTAGGEPKGSYNALLSTFFDGVPARLPRNWRRARAIERRAWRSWMTASTKPRSAAT